MKGIKKIIFAVLWLSVAYVWWTDEPIKTLVGVCFLVVATGLDILDDRIKNLKQQGGDPTRVDERKQLLEYTAWLYETPIQDLAVSSVVDKYIGEKPKPVDAAVTFLCPKCGGKHSIAVTADHKIRCTGCGTVFNQIRRAA